MAKREYSSGLQHLKFMQRAQQREEALKQAQEETTRDDESHWEAPVGSSSSAKKCVVILEGDPKPGALLGRMSFQNFNASVEKLLEDAESALDRRMSAAKERLENASDHEHLREARSVPSRNELSQKDLKEHQNKKLKVQDVQNSPSKPWKGWRDQGDYRLLRAPGRR